MQIEYIENGFLEVVNNNIVEKIICDYDGYCTIYFFNKPLRKINVGCSVFNRQYGIPISEDGNKLFVGSWEKGLYAYDITSGKVLWRFKPGKIRNIFVQSKYLIALRAYTSIIKIDINTGELLAEIKSGTIEHIFNIGLPYVFADTIAGKHCVVDTEKMIIFKKYSSKITNPADCLSLMIQNVELQGGKLIISGIEEYPQKTLLEKHMHILGGKSFRRKIDPNFERIE